MSKRGSSHRARRLTGVCSLVVALLMLAWQAAAFAGPGGGGAGQQSDPGTAQEAPAPAEEEEASAPASSKKENEPAVIGDSQANTAQEEPVEEEATGGASASAVVVDIEINGNEVLTISESKTEAKDDSCHAEANVLVIVGTVIFGESADCAPGQDTVAEGSLANLHGQTCGSGLCLAVLYGYAQATDNADSTESHSQSDVVNLCLGGEQESVRDYCTGTGVGARVGHSKSDSSRNKKSGEAGAHQESSLLEVCLGGEDPETGICDGIGVVLLHSEGDAVARPGQTSEVSGQSQTICVEAQGEETPICYDGNNPVIPPGCDDVPDEERPGALCIGLNDGDVTAEAGKGSGHQEAITLDAITVISGSIDQGDISVDSTKVKGEKVSPPKPPKPPKKPEKKKPTLAGPAGPALANTGVSFLPTILFALGLMLLGLRLVRTPAPVRRS